MKANDLIYEHIELFQQRHGIQDGIQEESLALTVCEYLNGLYEYGKVDILKEFGSESEKGKVMLTAFLKECGIQYMITSDKEKWMVTLMIQFEESIHIYAHPGSIPNLLMGEIWRLTEHLRAVLIVENGIKIVGMPEAVSRIKSLANSFGLRTEDVPFEYLPNHI